MSGELPSQNGHGPLLGSLIERVQDELVESQRSRMESGKPSLFAVESLTIEAQFVVSDSTSGKGGFSLKIVTVGGEATYKTEQIHKVCLTLKVLAQDDDPLGEALEASVSGRYPRRKEL